MSALATSEGSAVVIPRIQRLPAFKIGAIEKRRCEIAVYRASRKFAEAARRAAKRGELPQEPEYYFGRGDRGSPNPQGDGPGFGPRRRDPDQPAPVPRGPLPKAGAGEVALPLPEQSTENEP